MDCNRIDNGIRAKEWPLLGVFGLVFLLFALGCWLCGAS